MKIWLSKNSEISLRRQLVTQVTLGIVSGDLPPGARFKHAFSCRSLIICDVLTAKKLGGDPRVRPFPVISDHSLAELLKIVS